MPCAKPLGLGLPGVQVAQRPLAGEAGQGRAGGGGAGAPPGAGCGRSLFSRAWCPCPSEPRFQPHHGRQLQSGRQGLMIPASLLR